MRTNREKYLVITEYDTIDAKCSECTNAGISLHYCESANAVINKISQFYYCANLKIVGVYKVVEQFIMDSKGNVLEEQQ